jgi:hypothetical protein
MGKDAKIVGQPSHIEMGFDEDEEAKTGETGRISFETNPNEERGKMGVPHDLLDQSIASLRVGGDNRVSGGLPFIEKREGVMKVSPLFMHEIPIRHEKLKVPDLRTVHRGIIHLVDNSVGERIPKS